MNIVVAVSNLIREAVAAVQRVVDRFVAFFERVHQARLRAQTFQALAGLSDAELAERGLKREEIAFAVLNVRRLRRSS